MKRSLTTVYVVVLAVSAVLGQENAAAPPPPKPADDGPSLEVTMTFIRDKMRDKARSHWTDVTADPGSCQLKLVRHQGPTVDQRSQDYTINFSFREVEKIEAMALRDYRHVKGWEEDPENDELPPDTFILRVLTTTEKSVHTHKETIHKKGKPFERYSDSGEWTELFDEDLANRMATAMLHAVELCGGGGKAEPF